MKNIKLMLIIVIGFSFASCSKRDAALKADVFQVIKPVVNTVTYQKEYVAEIQAVQYVEIRSRVKGYVERIHVDEGQMVNEGQLLFTISSKIYKHELQKANAALNNALADLRGAEVELVNVTKLADKNIVSKAELKMVEAKVQAFKANVEEAEAEKEQAALKVSFSQIKAPYKGFINRIAHKTGSLIEEGTMLTTLSDNREVFAYFNLSETDYLKYMATEDKKGSRRIELLLANNLPYNHEGNIEITESEFDRSTGNIAFRARFPNPDRILKHGANGKVIVKEQIENAVLIPQKSTFEIQDKLYVFVVKKDSTVEQRNIATKTRIPNYFVIESGLTSDDVILYEGIQSVKNGGKILPQILEKEKLLSSLNTNSQ
jgi:RND family efflux transporter MFP subunit